MQKILNRHKLPWFGNKKQNNLIFIFIKIIDLIATRGFAVC